MGIFMFILLPIAQPFFLFLLAKSLIQAASKDNRPPNRGGGFSKTKKTATTHEGAASEPYFHKKIFRLNTFFELPARIA
jgi:hypothetical protein